MLYDKRMLTVVSTKPGQVAPPVVSPRNGGLHVDWEAPTTGGTPDHYDVWHREGTSGAWTKNVVRGRTSTTITGLTNGTSYQVQVRAANTRDGAWSEIVTGTPLATGDPIVDPPVVLVPAPEPNQTCGTERTSGLVETPVHLDIVPISDRKAKLIWTGSASASRYTVQVKPSRFTAWDYPTRGDEQSGAETDPCFMIDLDSIMTSVGPPVTTIGFGSEGAFDFRVTAWEGTINRGISETITIIDTPISAANGHSPGTDGQIALAWRDITDIFPATQGYQGGTYIFRYRQLVGDHTQPGWTPDNYDPNTGHGQLIVSSNLNVITELSLSEIYAVQFTWNRTTAGGSTRVRAARDAYAWTSGTPPSNGTRVGTFPVNHALDSNEFLYRICLETFPEERRQGWAKLIPHAFDQWEAAGNQWGAAGNLITLTREIKPCADFSGLLGPIAEKVEEAVRLANGVMNLTPEQKAEIRRHAEALGQGYDARDKMDIMYNEVIMFDDVQYNVHNLIGAGVLENLQIM